MYRPITTLDDLVEGITNLDINDIDEEDVLWDHIAALQVYVGEVIDYVRPMVYPSTEWLRLKRINQPWTMVADEVYQDMFLNIKMLLQKEADAVTILNADFANACEIIGRSNETLTAALLNSIAGCLECIALFNRELSSLLFEVAAGMRARAK